MARSGSPGKKAALVGFYASCQQRILSERPENQEIADHQYSGITPTKRMDTGREPRRSRHLAQSHTRIRTSG
ncbi:hypothetical protein TorRG33x02_263810 [Trema orientale]|uniref:Uncharacterized protein n=1 Tax=Trema orientale TaxID=63057 RepID=A0A2P5D3B1_TREOI|nr:hypothetical protein TorRG33x02_263810 [Trema orientale]